MRIVVFCFSVGIVFLTGYKILRAQAYEGKPCGLYENSTLRKQVTAGFIPAITWNGMDVYNNQEAWATSSLRPEGKKPALQKNEEDYEHKERLDRWTCMYTPFFLTDGDPKSAWVEGVPGDGIGETVFARVDLSRPLEIWTGYGKSETLFQANARPRQILASIWVGTKGEDPGGAWEFFQVTQIKKVSSVELTLADKNGYQPLKIPVWKANETRSFVFLSLTILSVYPGSKFQDTAISEVRNKKE